MEYILKVWLSIGLFDLPRHPRLNLTVYALYCQPIDSPPTPINSPPDPLFDPTRNPRPNLTVYKLYSYGGALIGRAV